MGQLEEQQQQQWQETGLVCSRCHTLYKAGMRSMVKSKAEGRSRSRRSKGKVPKRSSGERDSNSGNGAADIAQSTSRSQIETKVGEAEAASGDAVVKMDACDGDQQQKTQAKVRTRVVKKKRLRRVAAPQ